MINTSLPFILFPPTGSDPADEWLRMGLESHMAARAVDAERQYRQALRLDPRHVPSQNNLAILHAQQGNFNEALLGIEKAAILDHKDGHLLANRALMELETERVDKALDLAEKAVELSPGVNTRVVLAMANAAAGNPEKAVESYNAVLAEKPDHEQAGLNACFAQTLTFGGPKELAKQRKGWHSSHRQQGTEVPHHQPSLNGKPIRVGYVSGDFKRHSAAFIFGGVLLHHSPRVEPYFYSTLLVEPDKDAVTKEFQQCVGFDQTNKDKGLSTKHRWRDISRASDEEVDAFIRQDRIDILVDLSGHTGGNRLPLFTRRPAPIQVTGWGFAHGTGCPEIDYFFADPVAVPLEERQHYVEKVWDLPCIVTYNPPVGYNLRGTSSPPINHNRYFTFGCYSRYEKLSDACLKAFRDILLAVPDSKLELKDHAFRRPHACRRVLAALEGVDPSRLLFSVSTGHPDHMLSYQQADLILDPFPHSGGVVCLEQLWMGVPIVTLHGTQAAGRTTASVLTAMDRKHWVTNSVTGYINRAVELATALVGQGEIREARQTLRQEIIDSPVMKGYAGAVEQAYVEMIREKTKVTA